MRTASAPDVAGTLVRLALAGIWLVSGALKLADPIGTTVAVGAYDVLADRYVPVVAAALPILELALGVLLLVGAGVRLVAGVSAVLLLAFVLGLAQAWARGLSIDCGCFGGGGPVTPGQENYAWDLVRDVLLVALAGWLVVRPRTLFAVDGGRVPHERERTG